MQHQQVTNKNKETNSIQKLQNNRKRSKIFEIRRVGMMMMMMINTRGIEIFN